MVAAVWGFGSSSISPALSSRMRVFAISPSVASTTGGADGGGGGGGSGAGGGAGELLKKTGEDGLEFGLDVPWLARSGLGRVFFGKHRRHGSSQVSKCAVEPCICGQQHDNSTAYGRCPVCDE